MEKKILHQTPSVFIRTHVRQNNDSESVSDGKLVIFKNSHGVFIEWQPYQPKEKHDEWEVVGVQRNNQGQSQQSNGTSATNKGHLPIPHSHIINFNIQDLRSFKKSKPTSGIPFLIFILNCGTTYPALHFHRGGTSDFLSAMKQHISYEQKDQTLFIVKDNSKALYKSLEELDVMSDQRSSIQGITQGFAKISRVKDTIEKFLSPNSNSVGNMEDIVNQNEEMYVSIEDDFDQNGFAVVSTGVYKPPDLADKLPIQRKSPLNPEQWSKLMDTEGRVKDPENLKDIIFRGGVDHSIRKEVWKFLLGYYSWDSNYKSRSDQRKAKVDDYFRMKLQWKSISKEQETRFSQIRDMKNLIDKDVNRTDRTHEYYVEKKNVDVLYDVLMTYVMYNFDLSYVQGMSDLLAPILALMENEVDAFWSFAGFMEIVQHNFDKDQAGMRNQLLQLQTLIKFYDPEFYRYLMQHDSCNMYFCFRWLLIIFKREFKFPEIMRLWEVYWTMNPCPNFQLLLCVAVLLDAKQTIINSRFGFTEILRHINDMSYKIELEPMLKEAEAIYLQLCSYEALPENVASIFGIQVQRSGKAPSVQPSPTFPRSPKSSKPSPSNNHLAPDHGESI
ncbi:DgyrCDS10937 [Dimorphilus gyrociliatus]|uniref:TBC1 domain family member 15 n=1 Tax=Dimorphilus gyrociliatus TaxID=2664684 RepID=A0A7I8W1S4_9ANNE|nr:DgyrCDS10937 [Dimorphilus gyrociliatus]